MKQAKLTNRKLAGIVEDFIKVALSNGFTYIGVGDYKMAEEFRLKGVKQLRYCKEYLAFGYDTLGNKTVVTTDGFIIQL